MRGLTLLLWGRGISALGDGLWFTLWAIYFTRVVGLAPTVVGLGMAVAAGVGLLATVPLGALADRTNARTVLVVLAAVEGVAMAGYLLVSEFWSFLVVTMVFVGVTNGAGAVRTALVAALVPGTAERLTALAGQRVAQHVGYAAGAGVGALVLTADRPVVYTAAIVGNAVTFVVLAVLTALVPSAPTSVRRLRTRHALADRPYMAVMAATSVLSLCWAMLSTGLPVWLAGFTSLPLGLGGLVVVISSVGIAALQIPAGRFAQTARQSARTAMVAGGALAASCVLLATTDGLAGAAGVAVLMAAALLHLTGELGYVAAQWGLSVTLMDERARGVYQGISQSTTATVQMFAPAVFTIALDMFGAGGWLLVGALFVCAVLPVPALTSWALRTRPEVPAAAQPVPETPRRART
ncbi:MFS transporter [Actinophytocola sp.]|uniref:MFS transporter n=1 Tax=Actinophytocola sp. TaxID=1872138 RepID=UPI002ED195A9